MTDTQAIGIFAGFGIMMIIVMALAILIPVIFYFITLQGTMNRLSPANRPFAGGLIWLSFVPFLGGIWYFVYICLLSSAIKKEYSDAGQANDGALPLAIGIIVASLVCAIPFIGVIAGIAVLVLWIMYWLRMAEYRKQLPLTPQPA